LRDPGPQLKQVLDFKEKIEKEKRYLFKSYDQPAEFCDEIRKHLAQWLRDHEKDAGGAAIGDLAAPSGPQFISAVPSTAAPEAPLPNFRFWIEETKRLLKPGAAETATYSDALFCARKALVSGASDLELAEAKYGLGLCQLVLNKPADALATFSGIATELDTVSDPDRHAWQAKALVAKAITLSQLGRSEEAVSIYDELIARFGTASELALRVQVAMAVVNTGVTLVKLGRSKDAIAVYDNVIARYGAASELDLRVQVAQALFNKGVTLGQLGRGEETISVYDDMIARFDGASESALREQVAKALINKGVTLGDLGRSGEEISVYDELIARFGAASELALREQVATALIYKGVTLGDLGRSEEALSLYDDVIARFGADEDPALKAIVENAKRRRAMPALRRRRLTAPGRNPNRDNPSSFRAGNWAETGGRSGADR
jgi:tetratricopeptide (TPR) repeat protein